MLVNTKIHIPHARNGLVDRLRLAHLLSEGMGVKLTLLSAPAGYGKTTALSEWARQHSAQTAWISLDSQDDDWTQFWSCVTASIRETIQDFGQTVCPLLENGPSASLVSSEPAIQAMLNELDQTAGELAIFLDDYHLIKQSAIHKSLSYLLEHLPAHIHLYIASRIELPIPTARLLAKGELQRITVQDLRFGLDEGLSFFHNATDLSLTREQVVKLCEQTEGWISGLQLAAISLKGSENITESIRSFSGHQHHISEYLLEEVFRQQPQEVRSFLLRTSILSRMNPSLCQAVTSQVNARELLEQLEQFHLFIVPLDDQGNWYRYHHLLSEFLQKMFSRNEEDERTKAHIQAASWLESHGFMEEAAEHYLAGRQFEDVVRVIEDHLYDFNHKKTRVIGKWLLQVPEHYLADRPLLEIFYVHLVIVSGRWESVPHKVEQIRIRYETLQSQMSDTEKNAILGDVYALCAISSYLQKDLKSTADYLIKADSYLTESSLFYRAGHNKHFGLEEFDDHLAYVNEHHAAAIYLRRMIEHWGPGNLYAAPVYASYSKLLYEWNRLEEAEAYIDQVLSPQEKPSNPRNVFHVYIAAARIWQGLGKRTAARDLIQQLKMRIDSPEYELFLRKIEAEQAQLIVQQGDIEYGSQWLRRCGMAYTDEASLGSVFEHLALVKVMAACGQPEEALILSEKLDQLLFKEDRLRDRVKTIILQSVIFRRIGRKDKAYLRLEVALRLAQPEGFIRSFIDEGPDMAELLSEFLRANQGPSVSLDYADSLLQAFRTSQPLPESIVSMASAKVFCFGRFQVTAGQGDRDEVKWRTGKTKELMAYLVHHRGKPVDKDMILESLWGEVNAERASGQFNTTVYYLRKNLGAIGLEGIVRHVNGDYLIQMNRLECDIDEFHQMISEGIPLPVGDIKKFEEKLQNLYLTGYLHGNDFPWAEKSRSRLENEYLHVLHQIYERYMQERDLASAASLLKKILEYKPLDEDIHAKLIRVYVLADDRISAMKQYDFLREMLQVELGVEPSESVKQLLPLDK
ncbi:MAG: hypothetical protein K0R75_3059 [Paenibacillaceae bacterium]|jgi:LuxR family maltose regulon positive regulatory protein|nr:hypothetical protein [Paenibacillaceae bacterium]